MKKIQLSAGPKLLKWLKIQSDLWGLKRATSIRLILEHRAENYPKGEPTPPARKGGSP